ncbi:MAG TPA: hypothetical protein VIY47_03520 [Ignavibacteriaceae bacterium]
MKCFSNSICGQQGRGSGGGNGSGESEMARMAATTLLVQAQVKCVFKFSAPDTDLLIFIYKDVNSEIMINYFTRWAFSKQAT